MIERTFMTNKKDADGIACGAKRFDFRSVRDNVKVGDRVRYKVMQNCREIWHPIRDITFEVTSVEDAPQLQRGVVAISIRKVESWA